MPPNLWKKFAVTALFFLLATTSHTLADFYKTYTITNNKIKVTIPTFDLSTKLSSTNTICQLINDRNWWGLYEVSSSEVKSTFAREDFINSFNDSDIESCKVLVIAYGITTPWARGELEITLENEDKVIYLLALKNENSKWWMFGTEEK